MSGKQKANTDKLKEWIASKEKIVFFGGAGVSTESGLPDFRSENGLYRQKFPYPPEYMLSRSFFEAHTEKFFEFYREKMIPHGILPNPAHKKLAEMEEKGKLKAIITQNIDGLHQQAGSRTVYELHGSVHRNRCMKCGKFYALSAVEKCAGIPLCTCGGVIKPEVVLYEETLPSDAWNGAVKALSAADLLIIAGTSLSVYPAANLINFYGGEKKVIIDLTASLPANDNLLVIRAKVGETLSKITL